MSKTLKLLCILNLIAMFANVACALVRLYNGDSINGNQHLLFAMASCNLLITILAIEKINYLYDKLKIYKAIYYVRKNDKWK